MEVSITTLIVGLVTAFCGAAATLIAKKVRSQDNFDQLVDNKIKEHIGRVDKENVDLRGKNVKLEGRIATMEADHFRIKQLELSVRMLSDALGRLDPSNQTLAMVRILFATMFDHRGAGTPRVDREDRIEEEANE